MCDFKVGDIVEVVNNSERYNFTRIGSYGRVVSANEELVTVEFEVMTGSSVGRLTNNVWAVSARVLALKERAEGTLKTPLERKIDKMYKRQPYYKKLGETHEMRSL